MFKELLNLFLFTQICGWTLLLFSYGCVNIIAKFLSKEGATTKVSVRTKRILSALISAIVILIGVLFSLSYTLPTNVQVVSENGYKVLVNRSAAQYITSFMLFGAPGLLSLVYAFNPQRSKLWVGPALAGILGIVAFIFGYIIFGYD